MKKEKLEVVFDPNWSAPIGSDLTNTNQWLSTNSSFSLSPKLPPVTIYGPLLGSNDDDEKMTYENDIEPLKMRMLDLATRMPLYKTVSTDSGSVFCMDDSTIDISTKDKARQFLAVFGQNHDVETSKISTSTCYMDKYG